MIQKKLFDIFCEAEDIDKTGFNERSKYNYVEEREVKKLVKKLFKKHKVLSLFQVTTSNQILNNNYHVTITYKFIDVEDGSFESGVWSGAGHGGDKGIFKAITGAIKSCLMHNLMITSGEDGDDEPDVTPEKPNIVEQLEQAISKENKNTEILNETPNPDLSGKKNRGRKPKSIEPEEVIPFIGKKEPILETIEPESKETVFDDPAMNEIKDGFNKTDTEVSFF